MKFFRIALAWLFFCAPVFAQVGQAPSWPPIQAVTTCTNGTEAAAFATRVAAASITLDATHSQMYCKLINGLVADGVWSKLDAIYFLATNAATGSAATLSLLNLKSSNFTITNTSSTFSADNGYTGTDASGSVFLTTNFNPTTATTPNFTQNSSHVSVWSNTNVASTSSGGIAVGSGVAAGNQTSLFPRFSDGKAYFRINDTATGSTGATVADSIGFYVANRDSSTTSQGYKNAVSQTITSTNSTAVANASITLLGTVNSAGTHSTGFGGQISAATIGGSLSSTDVTNLYNRLATARTAVGL